MFGASVQALRAPRPSFATTDEAYFYVVLTFVVAAVMFIVGLNRSRLGRLLRAMADSPTALTTSGTSVTVIKVIVFCIAAFLAALGGALLGPVTGQASPSNFAALAGLYLVVLAVISPGSEFISSFAAAFALAVLPSYITNADLNNYLPVTFGLTAVFVAMGHAGMQVPGWMVRAASRARPQPDRSPITARVQRRPQPEVA